MKKTLHMLVAAALLVLAASCSSEKITGSGSVSTEDRAVNNFTAISTEGSTDVKITKGTTFSVSVKGYNNLIPYLETVVINNTLHVRFKKYTNVRNDNTEVAVTMPALDGLAVSGSANIFSTGDFTNTTDFETRISGSGDINIEKGSAKNFNAQISGSGHVRAYGLQVENAKVRISGSGSARVTANDKLNVEISGSGNVYYKGSPSVFSSISGSGKVEKQ